MLKKTIRETQPDIIHSCSVITDCIYSMIRTEIPAILTLHCFIYEDVKLRYGMVLGGLMCKREEKAIKKASVVIACSKTLASMYKVKLDREFFSIQNGIETKYWSTTPSENRYDLRQRLGLPLNKNIILSTGMMNTIKDPLFVIESFIESRLTDTVLVMLGDGELEKQCKKYSSEKILFPGRVDNVKDYLYACDLFVSASKSEGLPYAVLEAMCTGIKIVLSDIPQHVEAVGINMNKVEFFSVSDKNSFINALRKNNYTDRIQYNLDDFATEVMSNKYQEMYSNITFNNNYIV